MWIWDVSNKIDKHLHGPWRGSKFIVMLAIVSSIYNIYTYLSIYYYHGILEVILWNGSRWCISREVCLTVGTDGTVVGVGIGVFKRFFSYLYTKKCLYFSIGPFLLCKKIFTLSSFHWTKDLLNGDWRVIAWTTKRERERVISVHDKFIVFVFLWNIEISWVFISERIRTIVPEIRMV